MKVSKYFAGFVFLFLSCFYTQAQNIGIGTNAPHSSALLELKSSSQGLLIPRVNSTQRNNIASPAKGLLVYDTTANNLFYHNGTSWLSVGVGTAANWQVYPETYQDYAYPQLSNQNRIVTINGPSIRTGGYSGVYREGGLIILSPSELSGYQTLLTFDGTGIQARKEDQSTGYYDMINSNLLLNKFGGNVGVANTNPISALDVNGAILTRNRLVLAPSTGLDPATNSIWALDNFTSDFRIFQQSNFYNTGNTYFTIQNNTGNVGIGTSNPTQKLSVNGSIRSKEVVVETGWADYVFDEQYRLKPLDEVEAYIKANKHLHNIPSAQEIEKNGLALGALQVKMMEKIEELTLYLIAQQKKIHQLEQQIQSK